MQIQYRGVDRMKVDLNTSEGSSVNLSPQPFPGYPWIVQKDGKLLQYFSTFPVGKMLLSVLKYHILVYFSVCFVIYLMK